MEKCGRRSCPQVEYHKRFWLVVAYLGVWILVITSLVPGTSRPHSSMGGSLVHLLAYSLVGTASGLAFQRTRLMISAGIALTGLAAVLEILQQFSPGRNPEFESFLTSSVGAWMGLGFSLMIAAMMDRVKR
jgi:VanZ family protein